MREKLERGVLCGQAGAAVCCWLILDVSAALDRFVAVLASQEYRGFCEIQDMAS